jgi:hypothetical protein
MRPTVGYLSILSNLAYSKAAKNIMESKNIRGKLRTEIYRIATKRERLPTGTCTDKIRDLDKLLAQV